MGLENEPILWPGNGATEIPTNAQLSYSAIENMTGAEVYLGTSRDAMTEVSVPTLVLQPATTYYWYVKALTADNAYTSPVYQFTTADEKATKPTPSDGEKCAQLRVATSAEAKTATMPLQWRPAADAKTYHVYLATSEEELDSHLLTSVSTNFCQPATLNYGDTYSWRVDTEKQNGDILKGDV